MNDRKRELPFIQILAIDNFLVDLEYLVGMKCPGMPYNSMFILTIAIDVVVST
jgi:hypothetical protein